MTFFPRLFQNAIGAFALGLMALLAACNDGGDAGVTASAIAQQTEEQPTERSAKSPTEALTDQTTAAATNEAILAAIAPLQVIYLAETHTSEGDHAAQLKIIETLSTQNELAIGLEMFQRPFQPALDAYLVGAITEAELVEQSEYESRWGYDWELYAPIIRFAKEHQIPLIALNTPTEVTRQVASQGLESLSGDALTYIPSIADIDTTDEAYKDSISAIFNAHGDMGHSLNFDNFFAAQVLWDETMAERIVQQLEADSERQVVVLVGEGHIAYDYGIPNRVERRSPAVTQASVRLIEAEQIVEEGLADFSWITP